MRLSEIYTAYTNLREKLNYKVFIITLFSLLTLILYFATENFSLMAQAAPQYPVRVTNILFRNGVGRGPTHSSYDQISSYYRGYGFPGTTIEITAQMQVGTEWRSMYGDTVFTVTYSDGVNSGTFDVAVSSGQNIGSAEIPYNDSTGFDSTWITSNTTVIWSYTVTTVSGEYAGALTSSTTESINWDRDDPPDSALFPPASDSEIAVSTTTTSFRLSWNPTDTSTNAPIYNEDFYEYRIYYQAQGESEWRLWNGAMDSTLRGIENNPTPSPVDDSALHFQNGRKYTTIPNLDVFTLYYYYITSVDVFGNETPQPTAPFQLRTQPFSIYINISDGIDSYNDFSDLSNPQLRTMREINIKVEIVIVTSKSQPDTVRVWFSYNNAAPDIIDDTTSPNSINQSAFSENTLFSVEAVSTNKPSLWIAYLSTHTPVISDGNAVRFIIESSSNNISTFSDKDISDEDPNDDEWTFYIQKQKTLTPWPARILNNVITKKNPIAYPSYYLSDDAYVTIKVYDIKGRPVSTLTDKAFRRGGQNIKEQGWMGTNKAQKKLGVGLYYIHFKAKRATDGKVILNKSKKVVISR
ncbi:MAG: hypothetical protein SVR08_17155 [Spirochaetota bacterium]|nr:hypothetical protein [Spirochaetota bacterium]